MNPIYRESYNLILAVSYLMIQATQLSEIAFAKRLMLMTYILFLSFFISFSFVSISIFKKVI